MDSLDKLREFEHLQHLFLRFRCLLVWLWFCLAEESAASVGTSNCDKLRAGQGQQTGRKWCHFASKWAYIRLNRMRSVVKNRQDVESICWMWSLGIRKSWCSGGGQELSSAIINPVPERSESKPKIWERFGKDPKRSSVHVESMRAFHNTLHIRIAKWGLKHLSSQPLTSIPRTVGWMLSSSCASTALEVCVEQRWTNTVPDDSWLVFFYAEGLRDQRLHGFWHFWTLFELSMPLHGFNSFQRLGSWD